MSCVDIPFQEQFCEAMLAGRKTQTARTKRYARPGDWFKAFGAIYEVTSVWKQTLFAVRDDAWAAEGFDSPESLEEAWNKLHPRRRFDPEQIVWVHEFKREAGSGGK